MAPLQAATIVELVSTVEKIRAITKAHPELKSVAAELLEMKGSLPILDGHGPATLPVRKPQAPRRTMSAAERARRSKQAKARWRKAKKAGKNSIGGAD